MMPSNLQERSGFTLVEVLVALGILIIGIVGVMQLFPASLSAARQAAERTITSQTAHSVLGQLRASSAEALFNDEIPLELLNIDRAGGLYGFTTTVDRLNGASEVYLHRVTFTVDFASGRRETFTTFVARQ